MQGSCYQRPFSFASGPQVRGAVGRLHPLDSHWEVPGAGLIGLIPVAGSRLIRSRPRQQELT